MDITINAKVKCQNQECGKITCVIINPISKVITHIVVQEKGLLGLSRLVPIERIIESKPNQITLGCEENEFSRFKAFAGDQYISLQTPFLGFEPDEYYLHPYMVQELVDSSHYETSFDEIDRLLPGELGIHRGATVYDATNDAVGHVDEFLISPKDDKISHLILREGHFWGQKLVTIPISEIGKMDTDTVYLKLDKRAIEELPTIPVKRLFL